jgi:hypothetical protein
MSSASSDASTLAVAVPTPLHPTLLAVHSCTRQHANLLVPGQIVSGLVSVGTYMGKRDGRRRHVRTGVGAERGNQIHGRCQSVARPEEDQTGCGCRLRRNII